MSRVTSKYQITIPPRIRKAMGISPGCDVDIKKEKGRYVLVVDPVKDLKKKWRGMFKDDKSTDSYIDDIRGEH